MNFSGRWFERDFRRNLVDMHIEDWDERFLSLFRPEEICGTFEEGECHDGDDIRQFPFRLLLLGDEEGKDA